MISATPSGSGWTKLRPGCATGGVGTFRGRDQRSIRARACRISLNTSELRPAPPPWPGLAGPPCGPPPTPQPGPRLSKLRGPQRSLAKHHLLGRLGQVLVQRPGNRFLVLLQQFLQCVELRTPPLQRSRAAGIESGPKPRDQISIFVGQLSHGPALEYLSTDYTDCQRFSVCGAEEQIF